MTTLSPDLTVGEIAAQLPASARVFESHGIDFCCGGKLPLSEACRARRLDPAAVLEEIEQTGAAADSTDWRSATLNSLIDHILSAHHAYLKSQLPRLQAMLEKILSKHSERHGDVLEPLAATFHALKEELDAHLMKEEMILFPLIRSLEMAHLAPSGPGGAPQAFHCGSVRNPIRVMVMEHDSAGEALARLRDLTSGYAPPEDACNTYRAFYHELAELERDLHRHIHLENNILFPRAVELE
jgi:regulator of cell morphogenesis and NO signaling